MGKDLDDVLDDLRDARRGTLQLLQGLSQEVLDRRPGKGRWSIGEITDHLVLFDELFYEDIEQLVRRAKMGKRTVIHHTTSDINAAPLHFPRGLLPFIALPLSVFSLFVPSAIKEFLVRSRDFRAQHPDRTSPRRHRPSKSLVHDLTSSLKRFEKILKDHTSLDFEDMRITHPLFGDSNVLQVLELIALHERRHQEQVLEAKKAVLS